MNPPKLFRINLFSILSSSSYPCNVLTSRDPKDVILKGTDRVQTLQTFRKSNFKFAVVDVYRSSLPWIAPPLGLISRWWGDRRSHWTPGWPPPGALSLERGERAQCCKHSRSSCSSRTPETSNESWVPEPQLLAWRPSSRPPSSCGDTPARTSSSRTSGWSKPPPSCSRGCPSGHCSGSGHRLSLQGNISYWTSDENYFTL